MKSNAVAYTARHQGRSRLRPAGIQDLWRDRPAGRIVRVLHKICRERRLPPDVQQHCPCDICCLYGTRTSSACFTATTSSSRQGSSVEICFSASPSQRLPEFLSSMLTKTTSSRNSSPNDRTPTKCRPSASPPNRKPRTHEHFSNRGIIPTSRPSCRNIGSFTGGTDSLWMSLRFATCEGLTGNNIILSSRENPKICGIDDAPAPARGVVTAAAEGPATRAPLPRGPIVPATIGQLAHSPATPL